MSLIGSFGARDLPGAARAVDGSPLALDAAPSRSGAVLCRLDGEVDNLAELAAELGLDPVAAPEQLLAGGYARLGEDVFSRLRGEFAAVLWDRERRTGAIARDRLGDRPLHYAPARDGGLAFGSELSDMLAVSPELRRPDETWLAHWLARRVAPAELTPFAEIRRLPGGHLLRLEGTSWSVVPWWRPRPQAMLDLGAGEAAEQLRAAMTAAVERATRRAQTPGVLLSGGFDSASVAALAAGERPPRAYSGVFPNHPAADESQRIEAVRSALRLQGVEQSVTGGGAMAATLEFVRSWGVPPATPNLFLWKGLMRQATEDGVDVLLDGEGGDELFGCSPPLLADILKRGDAIRLLRQARRIPGMGPAPRPRWVLRAVRRYGAGGLVPASLHTRVRRARRREERPAPWLAEPLRGLLDDSGRDAWKRRRGPRWWAALVDAVGRMPDAFGAADQFRREGQDAGLRMVHPWRDTELIDFVLRLPPELAFDPELDRALAREAMRDLVPDAVRLNDSKPYFNDLLSEALTGEDRALVEELVAAPELEPYVRRDALAELLDPARGVAWSVDGWRVASAAAWLRSLADPADLERLIERAGRPRAELRGVPVSVS